MTGLNTATRDASFTCTGPAQPATLSTFRALIRQWLRDTVGLDDGRVTNIVVAATEALSNCVKHAYRDYPTAGAMTLKLAYDGAIPAVQLWVADQGRWVESTHAAPNTARGCGLMLMHALADACTVRARCDGTTVCLEFHDTPRCTHPCEEAKPH